MRTSYGVRLTVIAIIVVLLLGFPAFASAGAIDGVVETVAPVLNPVLAPVVETVAPVLNPVLAPVVEPLSPILEPVVGPLSPILEPVVEPLSPVIDPVAPIVDPILGPSGGSVPGGSVPGGDGSGPVAPGSDGQAAPGTTPGSTAGGASAPASSQPMPPASFQDPGSGSGPGSPGQWGLGRFENGGPGGGTAANMKVAPAESPTELFSSFSPSSGLAILPMLGLFSGLLGLAAYFKSARQIWQAGA